MSKNERECLISKLNEINEKIKNNANFLLTLSKKLKGKQKNSCDAWANIELILLGNQKIMIEQALINDFIEEL